MDVIDKIGITLILFLVCLGSNLVTHLSTKDVCNARWEQSVVDHNAGRFYITSDRLIAFEWNTSTNK